MKNKYLSILVIGLTVSSIAIGCGKTDQAEPLATEQSEAVAVSEKTHSLVIGGAGESDNQQKKKESKKSSKKKKKAKEETEESWDDEDELENWYSDKEEEKEEESEESKSGSILDGLRQTISNIVNRNKEKEEAAKNPKKIEYSEMGDYLAPPTGTINQGREVTIEFFEEDSEVDDVNDEEDPFTVEDWDDPNLDEDEDPNESIFVDESHVDQTTNFVDFKDPFLICSDIDVTITTSLPVLRFYNTENYDYYERWVAKDKNGETVWKSDWVGIEGEVAWNILEDLEPGSYEFDLTDYASRDKQTIRGKSTVKLKVNVEDQ